MDSYKLKFQNGRTCTIDCDDKKSFQDKINEAENRFSSECVMINDKPIEKHSVGGFIVGATIGAILGNSVPAKTISKTATGVKKTIAKTTTGVKRTAKKVTKSVNKQVRKFSGGGSTDGERYCRVADDTGKGINEGYVVGDGEMYFETEKGLLKHLREMEEDASGMSDDFLLKDGYDNEVYYWTEWDCDQEIEDQGYYYTADGEEVEIASKGKKIKSTPEYEDSDTDDFNLWDDSELALYLGVSVKSVKADREDAVEQAEELRRMSNEGYYAKGTKVAGVPRWWNKQVREYMYFVFNTETNKVWAGNEYENDAKDELKEFLLDAPKLPLKVLSKRAITNKKINPLAYENWARGTEVIDTIKATFDDSEKMSKGSKVSGQKYVLLFITNDDHSIAEWFEIPESKFSSDLENSIFSKGLGFSEYYEADGEYKFNRIDETTKLKKFIGSVKPEQMARGSKVKSQTNNQRIKALVKDLENTPYSIGLAILRERLLTYSENDLRSLEKNPSAWSNPMISLGMYKDYYERVAKELSFDSGKDNVKAVKGLVKDLENTPYSIGLAILRERLLAYAENDLRSIDKNPSAWSNPMVSIGMYKDYANRVINELKFEFETGGVSSLALAGASPQLAIADQVSQRLPATTSALDRRIASQIDPDRPRWYEDRGMQKMAKGGKVGDEITFNHWSGDVRSGEIIEDLGNGNFDVSSGYGRVLVNSDDIISSGAKKSTRSKLFGIFENGGSTDYSGDYEDIGQFSVPDADWQKYSQKDFEEMGRKIVEEKFGGNLGLAYDEIVHDKTPSGQYVYVGNTMINGLYEPVFKKHDKYFIKRYNPVRYDFLDDEKGIAGWRIHKMR